MAMGTKRRRRTKRTETNGIPNELLDQLIGNYQGPEDFLGEDGLLKRLTAALINRASEAELAEHLGYERGQRPPEGSSNRRNGHGKAATIRTNQGPIEIERPRDREGSFEPQMVPKRQTHFNGFDDKILSMYARGMSTREIEEHIREIYGVDVSRDLVSRVTDGVLDELKAWQLRALDETYPIVYLDALVVKIRDKGVVTNKSVYLAVGVKSDGHKEVLGMWIQRTEGAKFWLAILNELKQRGLKDILILCADGLTGLPDAVEAAYPQAIFQTCIVHMIRSSVRYVPWKDRRAVCASLKAVYTAVDADAAELALIEFEEQWGSKFPMVAPAWRARWAEVIPFLEFPPEIRRAVYTTNAIEGLNRRLRKLLKTRGHMPNDEAASKLLYLGIRNATGKWGNPPPKWAQARLQFAIHFGERFPN